MSFNVRYDTREDGQNSWQHRKDIVAGIIRFHQADIVGFQEVLPRMAPDIIQKFAPGYTFYGVDRNANGSGEMNPIMYRTSRFECQDKGTFWLSDTPHQPGVAWNACLPRICSWMRLREHATGRVFVFLNTHFDHMSALARDNSARLLLQKITELGLGGRIPCVLTGDFNDTPDSQFYKILTGGLPKLSLDQPALRDTRRASKLPPHGPTCTFTGFVYPPRMTGPQKSFDQPRWWEVEQGATLIDFIFVTGGWDVEQFGVLGETYDGRLPSDHRPILAELTPNP